ncbi:MAG TPA: DUF2164 domain-containing protein [Opitutaceae bacterium]|nr:DUF2164 domain-containing protein [Opitutaceae bacterium]
MAIELSKQEIADIIPSLQKYFNEELEQDLSEMRAKFLLDYFLKEIAPFAYNKGVKDSEAYFRSRVEDLTATCFEDGLTYWVKKRKGLEK